MQRVPFALTPKVKNLIQRDLDTLEEFINKFDYSALRRVKVKSGGEISYHATKESVQQLFSIFCHRLLKDNNLELREAYTNIKRWGEDEKLLVLRLGNLLMRFKNNIGKAEEVFFNTRSDSEAIATLKDDSHWVIRLQYIIEMHLDKMGVVEGRYLDFIDNIKLQGEYIYQWIIKNSPLNEPKYRGIGRKQDITDFSKERAPTNDESSTLAPRKLF